MSTLIVEVCEVAAVEKHPYADRLAVATVKGWKTCIGYDPLAGQTQFKVGDKCVYFPPDSVMPTELSDRLGITKYLAPLPKNPDGTRLPRNRVRATRLRGLASYGVIIPATDNPDWKVGDDVAEFYGITKWEPPEKLTAGNWEKEHPVFHRYTDIENWRNFPGVFQNDEEIVITEKIHGTNSRVGLLVTQDDSGEVKWKFVAGSHNNQWKEFDSDGRRSLYWEPLAPQLKALLEYINQDSKNVIAFGEIYGFRIQDMTYGMGLEQRGYRLFDISVGEQYLDFDEKEALCRKFGIEMVPVLYRGPYSVAIVEKFTDGPTMMCSPDKAGPFKGREGVVITPVKERSSEELMGSRAILKSVSADYHARKEGTDSH